jgi:putative PEP-CTERM system TPR-repeat lipoprotein
MNNVPIRPAVVFSLCVAVALFGCGRIDPEAELATARERMATGAYGEAAIRLSNVVQAEPENVAARRLRGELALLLGEYANAADEFERAEALGAPRETIALGLAEAWTVLGEADRALELLDSTAATLADDTEYWTVRAEALIRAGRAAEVARALEQGEQVGDGGSRARIAQARAALALGGVLEAEALLNAALGAAPNDPEILITRADLFARTGRLDEAAVDLQRAADLYAARLLSSREIGVLLALAQLHLARNDLDAAQATATRLTEQAPQAQLTAYLSGLVEFRRGNFDRAAGLIEPLVNAVPANAQFRALLGAIHLARGSVGQAEQQFLTVLATNPRDPAAVKLLAETRLRQQRPEAALDALRAVQDTATEDPQIGFLSGLANLLAGNPEQGLLYLEQAASLDPANELLRLQLARAYLAAGRSADASTLLQRSFAGGTASLEAGLLRFFADIRTGSPDTGDTAAAELLAEFPDEPLALTAVAIHLQLQGQNERARELFERAAALETEGATARLFVAAALVQEGRADEAEQLLAEILETQPDNAQVLTARAQLLAGRGELDQAALLLTRAAEHSPSIAPRLALAQLRLRQSDLEAARRELEIAAEIAPDNAELAAMRGVLAFAEGRADEAVELLRSAEAALPNRLGVTLALAQAEVASGDADSARTTLRRVLEIAPRSLPVRFALGGVELRLGNPEEALSIAAALKADFPAQSAGYVLEGNVQTATRRYAAAASSFALAFEREPTWPVHARMLEALRLAGRTDEALSSSAAWTAEHPDHVPGALMYAGLLQAAERDGEALPAYDAVLSLDATNLVALNNAAWLAQKLGDPRALELAERAHGVAGDNPAVLDTLGWVLLARGRAEEAVTHLSLATEAAPQALEIRYHLAEAFAALGRSTEAEAVLTALLAEERDFEQRAAAARLLETLQ